MPITEEERSLYYELKGIPNQASVLIIDGPFGVSRSETIGGTLTAKTEIDARLDALTGAPLARLQDILAQWKSVSFSTTRLHPKESNEGVEINIARQRALLVKRADAVLGIYTTSQLSSGDGIPLG